MENKTIKSSHKQIPLTLPNPTNGWAISEGHLWRNNLLLTVEIETQFRKSVSLLGKLKFEPKPKPKVEPILLWQNLRENACTDQWFTRTF